MDILFIPFIAIVALVLVGIAAYALIGWLRHRQLDPQGDRIERREERDQRPRRRPEHVRVESEQRAHFADSH